MLHKGGGLKFVSQKLFQYNLSISYLQRGRKWVEFFTFVTIFMGGVSPNLCRIFGSANLICVLKFTVLLDIFPKSFLMIQFLIGPTKETIPRKSEKIAGAEGFK